MFDFENIDWDWEDERRARLAHRRRMWFAKRFAWFVYAVCVALIVGAIALLVYVHANEERWERAAYIEGRYGVSRDVALAMADAGIGKCARELIDDYRAARAEREPYHVATVGGDVLGAPQKEVR